MLKKQNKIIKFFRTAIVTILLLVLCAAAFAQTKVATDPTRISVGARPLGMGKAFVAIANDASAVFTNPAGLGGQDGWKFSSMSSKFINEVQYLSLSSLYGTEYGTFAISYVGSNLGFVTPSTTIESIGGVIRVIQITGESDSYSYNNNVMLASYGTPVNSFFGLGKIDNLYMGANFKIFSQGLTGRNITGGIASGYDMDIGLLYLPSAWISTGLVIQDVLPRELGGKLTWPPSGSRTTPIEEDLPAFVKAGVAFKLLGQGAPFRSSDQELVWAIDGEYADNKAGVPALIHTGLEWWPVSVAALRVGIDQDFVGSGTGAFEVSNNLTAGVGLSYKGFCFDYAYHQYNNLPQNDTHYFSLSFALQPPWLKPDETKVFVPVSNPIVIDSPAAKELTVYDEELKIKGRVLDERVAELDLGGKKYKVGDAVSFEAVAKLGYGRNIIKVKAMDGFGVELGVIEIKVLRLKSFTDIDKDYFALRPIELLSTLGVISGYPDGTFKPEGTISRAELATLLVKAKGIKAPTLAAAPFSDVPVSHWAAPYVKAAVDEGYVKGYPDGTFKPKDDINRVEGILVVARFADLKETPNLVEGPFPDLPGRHWAAKMVDAAKKAGMLDYLSGKILKPKQNLTRGEAAEIISKAPPIKQVITPLINFSSTYDAVLQAEIVFFRLYVPIQPKPIAPKA